MPTMTTTNTYDKDKLKLAFSQHIEQEGERVKYLADSEISTVDSFHSGTWCLSITYGIFLVVYFIGSIILTYFKISISDDAYNYLCYWAIFSSFTIFFT